MADDTELEARMRAGLERRADEVDVAVPVVARATGAVRRRHRAGLAIGFAAASVAAVVAVTAINSNPPEPEVNDVQPADEVPDEWRTEYWADLRVDVPADWGYGEVPVTQSSLTCAAGASMGADGSLLGVNEEASGYVGRPLPDDACIRAPEDSDHPRLRLLSYVWLGVDLPVGTVERGNGFVQETVEVNGSRLTVGSDDPEIRERILDSASGGELCLSEVEYGGDIRHDAAADGAEATAMNVCAYRLLDGPESVATLIFADRVGGGALASYLAERKRAPTPTDLCPTIDYAEYDWVVLELVTDDGSVVDQDVVHLGTCPGIDVDPESLSGLERVPVPAALAAPWHVGGIRAVVRHESLGLHR